MIAIERAVRAVQGGEADAIVTAPISKEALHLAGKPFPGHTELLTALTGGNSAVMMLAHGTFRVSHLTTHIPWSRAGAAHPREAPARRGSDA